MEETRHQETKHPYFEMSPADRAVLISRLANVRLDETRAEVEQLLGRPTSDQSAARKEDGSFLVRVLKYSVTAYEKGLVNEKMDERVDLFFDASDRLVCIFSSVKGAERDEGHITRPRLKR